MRLDPARRKFLVEVLGEDAAARIGALSEQQEKDMLHEAVGYKGAREPEAQHALRRLWAGLGLTAGMVAAAMVNEGTKGIGASRQRLYEMLRRGRREDCNRDWGRQSLTASRWGGLLLAKAVSPLTIVRARPRPAKGTRVPDSQLPLFQVS